MPRFRCLTWSVKHTKTRCSFTDTRHRLMRVRKGGQQSTSTVSCVALSLLYHTRTQRRVAVASLIVTSCHVHGGHSARCSMVHSSTANSTALHRSTSTYHGQPWDVDFYSSTAAVSLQLYTVYILHRSTPLLWTHPTQATPCSF